MEDQFPEIMEFLYIVGCKLRHRFIAHTQIPGLTAAIVCLLLLLLEFLFQRYDLLMQFLNGLSLDLLSFFLFISEKHIVQTDS